MASKEYKALKDLKQEDVLKKLGELEKQLLKARCDHSVGTLENLSMLKKYRKQIAVAKTVLNQIHSQKSDGIRK